MVNPESPELPESIESAVRAYSDSRRLTRELQARWLAWAPTDAAALLEVAEALGLGGNQIAYRANNSVHLGHVLLLSLHHGPHTQRETFIRIPYFAQ